MPEGWRQGRRPRPQPISVDSSTTSLMKVWYSAWVLVCADAPPLSILSGQIRLILRRTRKTNVVGHHNTSRVEPARRQNALEVWQVLFFGVVNEHHVQLARPER